MVATEVHDVELDVLDCLFLLRIVSRRGHVTFVTFIHLWRLLLETNYNINIIIYNEE